MTVFCLDDPDQDQWFQNTWIMEHQRMHWQFLPRVDSPWFDAMSSESSRIIDSTLDTPKGIHWKRSWKIVKSRGCSALMLQVIIKTKQHWNWSKLQRANRQYIYLILWNKTSLKKLKFIYFRFISFCFNLWVFFCFKDQCAV